MRPPARSRYLVRSVMMLSQQLIHSVVRHVVVGIVNEGIEPVAIPSRSRRSASAWAICLQRPFAETSAHPCRGIAPPDLRAAGEGHTQDDPAISHATYDQPMHERCAARLKNAQFARACGSFVLGALATNERITSQRALLDAGIRPAFLGGLCREI